LKQNCPNRTPMGRERVPLETTSFNPSALSKTLNHERKVLTRLATSKKAGDWIRGG
jgi:hypothetical protein